MAQLLPRRSPLWQRTVMQLAPQGRTSCRSDSSRARRGCDARAGSVLGAPCRRPRCRSGRGSPALQLARCGCQLLRSKAALTSMKTRHEAAATVQTARLCPTRAGYGLYEYMCASECACAA